MSGLGIVVTSSLLAIAGVYLVATGVSQDRPTLRRAIAQIRRPADTPSANRGSGFGSRIGSTVLRLGGPDAPFLPDGATLRLSGRSPDVHAASLVLAALLGATLPFVAIWTLQYVGVAPLGIQLPVALALGGAALGPVVVHSHVVDRAREVRIDLRHQLSAYLDVVTMLLAGNSGHEGALEQAAHAGDGRLFRELRRRMREVGASGRSLVDALDAVGRDLGLVELQQVAATASLSAAEGAPVARTLAAKCATLRSTLASEQESEARLRTSRLTPPLVGMSLIFMALVIYPALSFSP